ncbi:MAG: hypothetical protein H9W80_09850 [Enterococcus sp.]|nr:hypothetical protein [Enterococcus sp.]
MNLYVRQLVVDVEDQVEKWIFEIEQIQEDLPESAEEFSRLEELKEKFNSVLEISEKLSGE